MRGQVVLCDGAVGGLHRKFHDVGVRRRERLADLGEVGELLVLHHLEERVGCGDPHAADVIFRVARMEAGCTQSTVCETVAGRLHAGDRHGSD